MAQGRYFFVEVDGLRLRVYDSADRPEAIRGPVLILLHGSPGQISNWKHLIRLLRDKYRVVAYDQRGYGLSDKPRVVSMSDYLSDLKLLLGRLGIGDGDAVLVGHSFGGMVAQEYAASHRVMGLVLIGSLVRMEVGLADLIVWHLPPIIWRKMLFTENPLTRRIYRNLFFAKSTPQSVFEEFLRDNKEYLEEAPAHMFRYLRHFRGYDATATLQKISCPTLVIVGDEDRVTPPAQSEAIHRLVKGSELRIVKGAGHLILYEKPRLLAETISSFIDRIGGSDSTPR